MAQAAADSLDDQFVALMDNLGVAAAQRPAMIALPADTKWSMIQQQTQKLELEAQKRQGGDDTGSAQFYAEGIKAFGDRAVETLQALPRVLHTCDMHFLSEFIDPPNDGVRHLFALQMSWDSVRKIQLCRAFVDCCRALMNNPAGFDAVMATPFAVRCLASYLAPLHSPEDGQPGVLNLAEQRCHVLELLAACSLVKPLAYALVMDALDNIRLAYQHRSRFSCVLEILQDAAAAAAHPALTVATMKLVNALVSAPEQLLTRTMVRTEFKQLGLLAQLEQLGHGVAVRLPADLAKQLTIFADEMAQDEEEQAALVDKVGVGDHLPELWELIEQYICGDGQSEVYPFFTSILQSLLSIPHGDSEVSSRMWRFAATAVSSTLQLQGDVDRTIAERYFAELLDAFGGEQLLVTAAQRLEEMGPDDDDPLTADLVSVVEKLNLNPAAQRAKEYAELRARIQTLRASNSIDTRQDADAGDSDAGDAEAALPSLEAHIEALSAGYNAQLQYLNNTIRYLAAGKSGKAPGAAPPLPPQLLDSVLAAPPKPSTTPPTAVSTPGSATIGIKPTEGSTATPPTSARAARGPPAPPPPPAAASRGGGPPPPPPPPGRGPPPPPGAPPPPGGAHRAASKPNPKPNIPMKSLNWMKIPPTKVKGTIFASLSEDSVTLDISSLESTFASTAASSTSSRSSSVKVSAPTFFDPKRSNNIGIMIARISMSNEELSRAILECDNALLTPDTLNIVRACVPTPEEEAEIEHFEGDISQVGKAELFQLQVGKVQHVRERLHLMCWMHEHHEQMQALIPDVEAITGALNDLVSSERFVELLKLVLAVGNYMNGGSFRGGAAGFKLDTLGKLADVRSTTHAGQTLLDFIVKLAQDKLPSVASGLEDELQNVEAGAGVAFSNIATELTSLQRAFKQSSAKMASLQDAAGSGALRAKLEPALRAAGEELARLEANVKNVEELRVSVLVRFGEDPKSADIEEILHLVVNFLASWRASGLKGGKSKGVPSLRKESAQANNVLDDKFADLATGNFRQSQRRSHPR